MMKGHQKKLNEAEIQGVLPQSQYTNYFPISPGN